MPRDVKFDKRVSQLLEFGHPCDHLVAQVAQNLGLPIQSLVRPALVEAVLLLGLDFVKDGIQDVDLIGLETCEALPVVFAEVLHCLVPEIFSRFLTFVVACIVAIVGRGNSWRSRHRER